MFKLFVFAAILAFAVAAPAPGPNPQVLVSGGVPVVSSVYGTGLVAPVSATYTATSIVHPAPYAGYVLV